MLAKVLETLNTLIIINRGMEGDSKPHGQVPWTNYRGKSVGLYKIVRCARKTKHRRQVGKSLSQSPVTAKSGWVTLLKYSSVPLPCLALAYN